MNTVTLAYDTIPPDMPDAEFLRLFVMYLEIRQRSTLFECLRFTVHRPVETMEDETCLMMQV